jgi:serine/threonine protein kinase
MMTTSSTFTCLAVDVTFSDSQNPFLVLCTVDGQILVLDAYDGSLQGGFSSGIPLVGASSSLKDNRRIVPGLDGSLYISDNVGFLQPLTISVLDVLQSPVKTCSSQQDCGIVTATKATSLFALSSSTGQLVWHQNAQGETTTTTTTTNENDNQSQPSSPTVLLQREDVLVQQISTDSGDQVWNVTLGTFQALEFGDQELLQNSDPLLPGERLDSLDKWLALDRADQHKTPPPTASSQLPNVIFGAEGTSLTAVDPHRSGRVLWKREFGTVVASVFGLSGKSWKPLTVLEEDDDDTVEEDNTDDKIPSNPAASRKQPWAHGIPRLLSRKLLSRKHSSFQDAQAVQATGLDFYQPPPWQQVLYNYLNLERIREHIGHLFSPFEPLTKRDPCLLPGACSEKRRLVKHFAKARETDLLAGLYQRPPRLELPSAPPQDMLHTQRTPEGLFLTWRLVLAIVITLVAVGGVVFRFLYVKKKQQWLQLIARATSPALSSGSLSTGRTRSSNVSFDELGLTLSQSGTTGTTINKKLLRRTQSLPDVHDDNFVGSLDLLSSNHKLLQHANTSEGKLIKTVQEQQADANNTRAITTTAAASSSAASGESHQGVGLIDGIPLVRYSRYDSEFDETVALGKGGFGTVFRCKNALDGREYAIKKVFIRHDQGYPQEFSQRLQRVLREVKILALLDHANIVRYYTAWLELEQGVSGEKDTSVSAAASDYYMFQSTTPKNMHGQFSSEMVTSPTRSPERQQRRVSLDPWKSTDPIGWNNVINNEDSLTRMDLAPPIQWDDYGFTFDRSENNINNNNNTDGSFATSTSDNEKDADASITNDGRGDFSSHGGGMEIGENSIASESSSHKSMTTWSQEDTNTNVTCNKEPVTATPKEEETLSSHAASTLVRHTLYIQMQLCSQKTLADFLSNEEARRGSSGGDGVDIPYALSLFLQIAQGVKHVHGQGLIHRDLKPNNCFIDDTGVVKVGDFGLSRESTDKGNEATPSAPMPLGDGTDNTAGVGTRSYASPEQMSGSDYDSSTDVYSLGIMLFELCYPMYTVRTPFACPY